MVDGLFSFGVTWVINSSVRRTTYELAWFFFGEEE